jgi:hypothetical protein
MKYMVIIIGLLLLSTPCFADRPNIVILLVDDLGWNDVGYHNPEVTTPNVDMIAKEGIELDPGQGFSSFGGGNNQGALGGGVE